jgi:hypothetical protein
MRRTTVVTLGFGIAIGFASSMGMQVTPSRSDGTKAVVDALHDAQATAFASFAESVSRAVTRYRHDLDVEAKRDGTGVDAPDPPPNAKADPGRPRFESMVAKKLAWCCVPGQYGEGQEDAGGRQVDLNRDGTFSIRPYQESGWSGTWVFKDGCLLLKSDRGWEKKFEIVLQLIGKDMTLSWQRNLQGE